MAPTRRRTSAVVGFAATAGLCFIPSKQLHCHSFSSSTTHSSRPAGGSTRGAAGITTRSAIRPRHSITRVCSTVEGVEKSVSGGKASVSVVNGHETLPLMNVDPEIVLFGSTIAAVSAEPTTGPRGSVSGLTGDRGGDSRRAAGSEVVACSAGALAAPEEESGPEKMLSSRSNSPEKPARKQRKGKDPEVVEGDDLANTPKMIALVWSSLALNLAYLLQAFASEASSPLEALGTAAAGAFVGYLIADLFSGLLHWSLDNYGSRATPMFGTIIESFQGHHASPWTITHRPFENNVHKVTYAALPLLALLRLADPGLFGVAVGVSFLYGSLMSNEFHKYSHMVDPPPVAQAFQRLGLSISRKQHGRHHSGTFDEKYCLVSGICNGPMDNFGVFRFLERAVYEVKGVEPIAWKLDPSLKEVALSTGWLPFAAAGPRAEVDSAARAAVDAKRNTDDEVDATSSLFP